MDSFITSDLSDLSIVNKLWRETGGAIEDW